MFKDNNAVNSAAICCEPVNETGLGDMLHKMYELAQDNTNAANRIHDFMFASLDKNVESKRCDPRCMAEELIAIMDELQRLRLTLMDINGRL